MVKMHVDCPPQQLINVFHHYNLPPFYLISLLAKKAPGKGGK